ncbi:type ISP restriction/modification enzyme [Streptomyces sp. NPDC059578]|uniref:type ISP restriction/modification enzyme n=1 Tax=Streptomyces sp. NPDC059578 TaxID=3346874 RepID=UPI0036C170DA
MPVVTHTEEPLLADLMPWSVAVPRIGRGWPVAPDTATLRARWEALARAEGTDRTALFESSRARTPRSAVAQLPGQSTGTARLAHAPGPFPQPLRVLLAPFDEQWLIPDHRLIDAARPELWRVADARQLFVLDTPAAAGDAAGPGPALLVTARLPVTVPPPVPAPRERPRATRVHPLFRRPGGAEPNLAPGLPDLLATRLGLHGLDPLDVLAWIVAAARPGPGGCTVPLTCDPEVWARGTDTGHRLLRLMVRADGDRPRLPGGSRPYVRSQLPEHPTVLRHDPDTGSLDLDGGRISPVPTEVWHLRAQGVRVVESWFGRRTAPAPRPGSLGAVRPAAWPQAWTSELLELLTVLALLAECGPSRPEPFGPRLTMDELRRAGVLPPPDAARRPASVLDHREEGPEGQYALL